MPAVIEDKIVRLNFQGEAFINGIKKATAALSNFTSQLDMGGAVGYFQELNAISLNKITNSLANLEYRFTMMGQVASEVTRRIAGEVINVAKGIEQATIGQIKSGGWSRAMNIANAKFQIEGLGYAWEKVEKAVSYGVKDTAYGLDAAASAASQLAASGVDFEKIVKTVDGQGLTQMHRSLRAISGVAAMTNSSYEEISHIFTTIAGNGKVMTEQLRMLSSRGLNAAAILGKAFGTTEAAVYEMVSKGEIDFQRFSDAMDDAFGKHAKEANKTFQGSLSNLKAALSRVGAIFATPIIDKTNTFFNSLTGQIDKLKAKLSDTSITNAAGNKSTVAGFATHFAEAWERGVEALSKVIDMLDLSWFDKIAGAADNAAVSVRDFFASFQEKFFPEEKKDESNKADKAVKKNAKTTKEAAKDIKKQTKGLQSQAKQLEDIMKLPSAAIAGLKQSGQLDIEIMQAAAEQYSLYAKAPAAALEEMNKAGKLLSQKYDQAKEFRPMTDDQLPQAAKDAMVKAGVYDYDKATEDNLTFGQKMFKHFENALKTLKDISSFASSVWSFVKKAFMPIVDAFEDVASNSDFTTMLSGIGSALRRLGDDMEPSTELLTLIYQVSNRVFTYIDSALTKLAKGVQYFIQVVRGLVNNGAFTDILDIMKSIRAIIQEIVKPFKELIVTIFKLNTTSGTMADNIKKITGQVADLFAGLEKRKNIFGAIASWVANAIGNIVTYVKVLFTTMKELGVFQDLAFIVLKLFQNITKIIQPIIAAFKNAFHIGDGAVGLGITIKKVTALVADMVDKFNVSDTAMVKIYNIFTSVFEGVKTLATIIVNVITTVVDLLRAIWDSGVVQKVLDYAKQAVTAITDFLTGVHKDVNETGVTEGEAGHKGILFRIVGSMFEGISELAKGIDLGSILKIVIGTKLTIGFLKIIMGMITGFASWGMLITKQIPEKINWILGNINGVFANLKKLLIFNTLPMVIERLAKGILYISISILIFSSLDQEKFDRAMIALVGIVLGLAIFMKVILKSLTMLMVEIGTFSSVGKIGSIIATFVGMAILVIGIATATSILLVGIAALAAVKDKENILYAGAAGMLLLIVMWVAATALLETASKNPLPWLQIPQFLKMVFMLMAVAGAMVIAAVAVKIMANSTEKPEMMISAAFMCVALAAVIGIVTKVLMDVVLALANFGMIKIGMIVTTMALMAVMMLALAASVLIISGALVALAQAVPENRTVDVSLMFLEIVGLIILVTSLTTIMAAYIARTDAGVMTWERVLSIAAVMFMVSMLMTSLGKAILEIGGAMAVMTKVSADQFSDVVFPTLIAIGILIMILAAETAGLGRFNKQSFLQLLGMTLMIGILCSGIASIMKSTKALSKLNSEQATAAIMMIITIVGAVAILSAISQQAVSKNFGLMQASLAIMVVVIAASAAALLIVASMCDGVNWKPVLEIVTLLGALTIAMAILADKMVVVGKLSGILVLGVIMLALAASVVILAAALRIIGDQKNILEKGIVLLGFLGAILVAALIIGKMARKFRTLYTTYSMILSSFGAMFLEISVGFIAMAYALKVLTEADISWKSIGILAAITAVVVGIAWLVGQFHGTIGKGMEIMSGLVLSFGLSLLAFGAGCWLIAKALDILGPALDGLNKPLENFFVLIKEHWPEALIVFLALIAVMITITVLIIKLVPSLKDLGSALVNTVTTIFKAIGNGITAFNGWFTSLASRSQIIIGGLIGAICTALITCSPEILETVGQLILKFFWYLGGIVGDLAEGLIGFIIQLIFALAESIANHSNSILQALENVLWALLRLVLNVLEDIFDAMGAMSLKSETQELSNVILDHMREAKEAALEADQALTGTFANATREGANAAKEGGSVLDKFVDTFKGAGDAAEENSKRIKDAYADLPDAAREAMIKAGVNIYEEEGQSFEIFGKKISLDSVTEALGVKDLQFDQVANVLGKLNVLQSSGMEGLDINSLFTQWTSTGDSSQINELLATLGIDANANFGQNFNLGSIASGEFGNLIDITGENGGQWVTMLGQYAGDGNAEFFGSYIMPDNYYDATDENIAGVELSLEEQKENLAAKGQELGELVAKSIGIGLSKTDSIIEMAECTRQLLRGISTEIHAYTIITGPELMDGLCRALYNTFREFNEIESPSKLYRRTSRFIVRGLSNGIESETSMATGAMSTLGETMVDAFGNPLMRVASLMNDDVEFDPSIRPVVDMGNVQATAAGINGAFENQNVSLSGFSGRLAADISGLDDTNQAVVDELRALREDMALMTEQINGMQVVMDSGSLVGAISAPMDRALGSRSRLGRRR